MAARIGIIGGGIVGMAIARALVRTGGFHVTVLEKEHRVAAHQTGHNSGVVHAGLYYQPGSLKAVLCARGRALTRDYCRDKGLPYRELGTLFSRARRSISSSRGSSASVTATTSFPSSRYGRPLSRQ